MTSRRCCGLCVFVVLLKHWNSVRPAETTKYNKELLKYDGIAHSRTKHRIFLKDTERNPDFKFIEVLFLVFQIPRSHVKDLSQTRWKKCSGPVFLKQISFLPFFFMTYLQLSQSTSRAVSVLWKGVFILLFSLYWSFLLWGIILIVLWMLL